jgi:hypothetical protein
MVTKLQIDSPPIVSYAPPNIKSIFRDATDIRMASRQLNIDDLSSKERKKQEEWAKEQIRRAANCPEGYNWNRMDGGYQCEAGGHAITDELLVEGKGGLMCCRTKKWKTWEGPFYKHPELDGYVPGGGFVSTLPSDYVRK